MAIIGTFTLDGEIYTGTINTLAHKAKTSFKPNTKTNDQAPDFRIYAGGAEIGAAWAVTSKANKPYLSVKLDDPGFPAPIYCRLVGLGDDQQTLLWSR
jgi:uncharacterized protein (DUF736 family)